MSSLYELAAEYQILLDLADDPETDMEVFNDTLEGISGEIEDKAENYAKLIKNIEVENDGLKWEIERLKLRKERNEKKIESLKSNLQDAMVATGKTKFKTNLFSFGVQKNTPSVVIDDEKAVDKKYLIPQDPKIDKMAINDAIKKGEKIEWAHLEQSESLRIR